MFTSKRMCWALLAVGLLAVVLIAGGCKVAPEVIEKEVTREVPVEVTRAGAPPLRTAQPPRRWAGQ